MKRSICRQAIGYFFSIKSFNEIVEWNWPAWCSGLNILASRSGPGFESWLGIVILTAFFYYVKYYLVQVSQLEGENVLSVMSMIKISIPKKILPRSVVNKLQEFHDFFWEAKYHKFLSYVWFTTFYKAFC